MMRLLILGGGSSQVNAFRRARERGFYTILADRDPGAPARADADAFARASTFDVEAVRAAAHTHRADALLVIGTDQPVLTAARVSAELGLPFPLTVEQAYRVTNKTAMKHHFATAGIACVPWVVVGEDPTRWETEGLYRLKPPWVVKPVDSQGQRGIAIVSSVAELASHRAALFAHSREHVMLVEEYYPSVEVTVSGWAHDDGGVEIWTITDRVTVDPHTAGLGVCLAHRYPSAHATASATDTTRAQGDVDHDYHPRIRELTAHTAHAFALRNAPIYFQMLIGADGVLVNEIAVRLGGAYEDLSIPTVTGIDTLARQLDVIERAVSRAASTPPVSSTPAPTGAAPPLQTTATPAPPLPRVPPPQLPRP